MRAGVVPLGAGVHLGLFGAFSLAAVAIGCAVAAASGVPAVVWARNPAAWVVGAALGCGLVLRAGARVELAFLVLATLGLAASFLGAGQVGVHRWVDLGPLHLNVAQVLLPPLIVVLAGRRGLWAWLVAAGVLALLVVQPDASQATAFGGALAVLLANGRWPGWAKAGGVAVVGAAVALAWRRPDPLSPVPEVEEIMRLAWAVSPLAAIAAWAALASACLSLGVTRTPAALALAAYAVLAALTPLMGWFPVPLVGMAMSPIVGLWLGAGLLAAQARRVSANTPAASGA